MPRKKNNNNKNKREENPGKRRELREEENEAHAQSKGSIGLNIWVFFCLVPVAGDNIFSGGYLNSILGKRKRRGR